MDCHIFYAENILTDQNIGKMKKKEVIELNLAH